jgi:hypothetical protein
MQNLIIATLVLCCAPTLGGGALGVFLGLRLTRKLGIG